jgi:ABC-type Fe3+-hydroxamate transport system substrate-binding protein
MGDRASGRVKVPGRFADVDRKLLRELKPTLILTGTSFQRRISDELRREGYVVLHSEPASFADVLAGIRKLGEAVGRARQARRVATEMAAGLERLQQRTRGLKPVRVYLETNHEGPWASGRRNPVEDLVRAAGSVNIFGDIDESVFRTSREQVIERAFGNPIFEPPKQSVLHVAVDGHFRHA